MLLHTMFIESALKYKDKIAIYDQTSGKEITYDKFLIASLMLAKKIKSTEEKYIGIMLPTGAGSMISTLSTLMAGNVPAMINYSTGAEKNAIYAQNKCGFKKIITSKKLLEKLDINFVEGMIFIEDVMDSISGLNKISALLKSKIRPYASVHKGNEDDEAVILFTSGSEKDPKAVMLTHKNILSNIDGILGHFHFDETDIFMSMLPLFHVFGLTTTYFLPIFVGASMVAHANPLEYSLIAKNIKKYQATAILATPTFFDGYNRKSEKGDFSSLRIAISGADKLSSHIRAPYMEKHGIELCEGYGATETSPVVSTNVPATFKHGSIGKPLKNVEVLIRSLETGEKLGVNEVGKILVKGDLVMKVYFDDLEETSFRMHNGWYDTGDMGMMDKDGFLWHKGRLKRFVKIAGEMVSLVAVENELEILLPKDSLCCVVEIPHPTRGAEILAAVTVEVDTTSIKKELANELPSIAIPKSFIFFKELPLMGNGKVNFREVTRICREQVNQKK